MCYQTPWNTKQKLVLCRTGRDLLEEDLCSFWSLPTSTNEERDSKTGKVPSRFPPPAADSEENIPGLPAALLVLCTLKKNPK